jgi:hypothetical protein
VVRPAQGALAECEDAFAASAGLFAAACAELAAPEATVSLRHLEFGWWEGLV